MSKNAMKKAARKVSFAQALCSSIRLHQAQIYAQRPEKRAAEKARKRERDAMLREQYKAGTLDPADQEWYEKRIAMKRARQEDSGKGRRKRNKTEFGGGVIIDLGFDELMHVGVSPSEASTESGI
jgi:tRNA (guanine9-N1)-methyltransferase